MTSLSKICIHWTGGANFPCQQNLDVYHFCVDKNGKVYSGIYAPEDNLNCYDGKYAKHCGGGNTGCIGISACGMYGFDSKKKQTNHPLTQKQVEALCEKCAELCIKYGIVVSEKTVFTHYEFDQKKTKPEGKIDITYLPYLPTLQKERVGGYLRNKVSWYIIQLKKKGY